MNTIFSNLSKQTLANIEDQVSNNEVSTDEEPVDLFIEALKLTLDQTEAAKRNRRFPAMGKRRFFVSLITGLRKKPLVQRLTDWH
ncbi:TPA: hypothetical protein QEM49_000239 [Pseudomonas putida]|nr:hypothetical protein [Pseudomonas putida]MDD2008316.1 hypothetical protein [Pseudomonas putida]HDS1775780.1 hypothetical protein [Pseudomonas putida]